jgi:hypothetical protein
MKKKENIEDLIAKTCKLYETVDGRIFSGKVTRYKGVKGERF